MDRIIVKLRFIGAPGGKLVKGAPGNIRQGEIVMGPADRVEHFPKIWQLAEDMPDLIIPKMTEVDSVFAPSEAEESGDFNLLDQNRSSSRSFVRKDTPSTDSSEDEETASDEQVMLVMTPDPKPSTEDLEDSTRAQLMTFIDSQGGTYKTNELKAKLLEKAKSLL